MTQDPSTGEGFDAVEVATQDYFDPNATDPQWPGVVGLQMRDHHFWQGDVEFDTYEALGPTADSFFGSGSPPEQIGIAVGQIFNPQPQTVVRPVSTFTPLLGTRENAIVIELHGLYGFPDAGGDPDPNLLYNTVCKIPVTPGDKFGVKFPSNSHWSVQLVGSGEVFVPGNEMLETIGWDSFWPALYDETYVCITEDELNAQGAPSQAIANLIWSKRWALPIRLVIGDPGIFTDYVIITDFSYDHVFGSETDYDYNINFKRIKSVQINSIPNPDSDVDHFSTIPLQPSTGGPGGDVSVDRTAQGLRNGEQPVDDVANNVDIPKTFDPKTVFPATVVPPQEPAPQPQIVDVVVLPRNDTVPILDFFSSDDGTGETLNQLSARMGVSWDSTQIALNPQYATLDPNVHLSAGAHLKIQLATPTIPPNTTPAQQPIPKPLPSTTPGLLGTNFSPDTTTLPPLNP